MKLADMNPNTGLVFRPTGRNLQVGKWRMVDAVDLDNALFYREVWHHDTLMGEWYADMLLPEGEHEWMFGPLSTGHGSVSDQQGMNRMLAGTGWRFLRSGGVPRYVHENGRYFPH